MNIQIASVILPKFLFPNLIILVKNKAGKEITNIID